MAITIDWGTKVINVPKADMLLVDPGPPKEIYQLDTDSFRLTLKDLEDGVDGMPFPDTHRHVTTTEVSGAVLARVIEIINGYTVEFEDGQYAVNLVGSNNNISDITVVNQVSVRSSNSAGLQDLNSLQAASFDGEVTLKKSSTYSGTTFPVGTRAFPVNNENDAVEIALSRGLNKVSITETMDLSGEWPQGFSFEGDNPATVIVTLQDAALVSNCEFRNLTIQGTLDGGNLLRECHVKSIDYTNGFMFQCAISGTVTLGGGVQASILDCYSNVAGGDTGQYAAVDMDGVGNSLALRNYAGGLDILNYGGGGAVSMDFLSGRCLIDPTVTGGDLYIRGVCNVADNSDTGATVYDHTITNQVDTHRKLSQNKQITDPSTGKMTVYDDDGTTVLVEADIFEDAAGTTPYDSNSQKIERRERLE